MTASRLEHHSRRACYKLWLENVCTRKLLQAIWSKHFCKYKSCRTSDLKMRQVQVLRFTRAILGLSQSQFLLEGTLKYHLGKYAVENNEMATTFRDDTYVDDLLMRAERQPWNRRTSLEQNKGHNRSENLYWSHTRHKKKYSAFAGFSVWL